MPRILRILSLLSAVLLAHAATLRAGDQTLPLTTFRNLQAGKAQTVVVYGTSLTVTGAWSKALEEYFQTTYPGLVTFHHSAKSGMHSQWGVDNLRDRVLSKHPDLVFLEFAVNDANTKNHVSLDQSRTNLDLMVQGIRKENPAADVVLQTMNPAWDSPANPAKTYATDRPQLSAYYNGYRTYAREHRIPLVDNEPAWNAYLQRDPDGYHRAVSDGIHPHSGPSMAVTWPAIRALLEQTRTAAGGKPAGPAPAAAPAAKDSEPAAAEPAPDRVIGIWPDGRMPGRGAKDEESRYQPERTDAVRITNVSRPTLTLFPAPGRTTSGPFVIVCPGGGYSYCVVDKEGSEIAAWLNTAGISAAVLKYRVPHNRDGAFQDVQRAIRLARGRAAAWHIDPHQIGVIGFSAGGHLAARAGNHFDTRSYDPVDPADQSSCRPDFAILVYPAYLDDRNGHLSPDMNPKAAIPPTLIIHSDDDTTFIAGSRLYHEALLAAGSAHQFIDYPTGGHGYGLHCTRDAKAWPDAALAWLKESGIR